VAACLEERAAAKQRGEECETEGSRREREERGRNGTAQGTHRDESSI
jgi:hypothetical protein